MASRFLSAQATAQGSLHGRVFAHAALNSLRQAQRYELGKLRTH